MDRPSLCIVETAPTIGDSKPDGLAWSASVNVARDFAKSLWQTYQGGSVLLETQAPGASIICALATSNDCGGEQEYLVDRRFLGTVKVIERFVQKPA
jgi:hypothetical protein